MLESVEAEGLNHIVSWQPHGRCFVVHNPTDFVHILARCFKISKVASFQRQLNLYGFQRLTTGNDSGGYYHELFLRGKIFLADNIHRIKVKGTKIRARSNPEQEPNFYAMPWVEESTQHNTKCARVAVSGCSSHIQSPHSFNALDLIMDSMKAPRSPLSIDTPLEQIPSSVWDEEEAMLDMSEPDAFIEPYNHAPEASRDNIEYHDSLNDLLQWALV